MTPCKRFKAERVTEIVVIGADFALRALAKGWLTAANRAKGSDHFEFLGRPPEFIVDKQIEQKLLVTVAPDGCLRQVAA